MKKKILFILMSTMLLFTSMSISGLSAQANSEIKLTPGQEKQAEEIANEWVRFDKLTSKLDESELERLLEAMFESSGIQAFSNATTNVNESNDIVVANGKEEVNILNQQLNYAEQPGLPKGTVSVTLQGDNNFVAKTEAGEDVMLAAGFWGGAWQVTKCLAHLTLAVIPAGAAFKAIKGLGGMKATAQLLVGAGNAKDFAVIAGGAAGEILGISGINENCLQW